MKEDLYTEQIVRFKRNERPETMLLVADNPERIKLVIAWTNLEVGHAEKLTEIKDQSENEIWDWLWENVRYSKKELLEKIGVPFSESALESKLKPLIGNRVLYPDGTVNSYIQRYLREQVLKLFEAKPKRLAKKAS